MNIRFILIIILTLASGCASNPPSNAETRSYCYWSQDESRWEKITQQPNLSKAIVAKLFDSPDAASYATGGFVKNDMVYDIKGHVINVETNFFGVIRAKDVTAQCDLTPKSYWDLSVGVYDYQQLVAMKVIKPRASHDGIIQQGPCEVDDDCVYGYSCRSKVGGGNECRPIKR